MSKNEFVGKDFSLEPPAPRLKELRGKFPRVLFISDVHYPFEDRLGVQAVLNFASNVKPDLIYLGGDIHDNYSLSDHVKDPDRGITLQDELDSMRVGLLEPINSITPRVIYQLGNHEERTYRMIRRERALNKLRSLAFKRAAQLPEHWTVLQDQTHLRIGKLLYHHGNLKSRGGSSKYAAKAVLDKLPTSSISGHDHRFDRAYLRDYDGDIRGAYKNGHLSDVSQARYITCPNWQSGISMIDYDKKMNFFQVYQLLLVDGKIIWNGDVF